MEKFKRTVSRYFHSDSSRGWLAVKRRDIDDLGIAEQISDRSSELGSTVYLDEGQDAEIYVQAMQSLGTNIIYRRSISNSDHSRIRKYPKYKPSNVDV